MDLTINEDAFRTVQETIAQRRTTKILADEPVAFSETLLADGQRILEQCIETAGMAPFHYDRGLDCVAEPWRIHLLGNKTCRRLAAALPELVDMKPTSKLPGLLNACCQMVLVNWIPVESTKTGSLSEEKVQQVNNEHLCATAAFTQNLLLLAQSLGWSSYWGSGGMLQSKSVMDFLDADPCERIAAAVYITYGNAEEGDSVTRISGKMHEKRSPWRNWTKCLDS